MLLPFNFSLPQAPVQIVVPDTQFELLKSPGAMTASPVKALAVQSMVKTPQAGGHISTLQIATMVWLIGCIIFILHQFISYFVFKKQVLRWSHPVENMKVCKLIGQLSAEMKIRKTIIPLISEKVSSPMMTGFLKPLLLLPSDNYTETELCFILKHELVHFQRHDIWYKLLLLAANAVHWFNPLAYIMFHEAGKDLEFSCDNEVIKDARFEDRRQYSETILASIHQQCTNQTALSTYFYMGTKIIKERFTNILNMNAKRKGIIMFSLMLVSIVLIGGLVACGVRNVGNGKPINGSITTNSVTNTVSSGSSVVTNGDDAASVVKKYLEAEKNNDYDAWKSTLWQAKIDGKNFKPGGLEKPGDLGVLSLTIEKVKVANEETNRTIKRYSGSDLAKSYGWSDEYISKNMLAVYAQYTVAYDHHKVPYDDGNIKWYFYLVRENENAPWYIWDHFDGTANYNDN